MRRSSFNISCCFCPDCNGVMYVPRNAADTREKYHIKNLWCPYCKEVKQMREVRERDFVM